MIIKYPRQSMSTSLRLDLTLHLTTNISNNKPNSKKKKLRLSIFFIKTHSNQTKVHCLKLCNRQVYLEWEIWRATSKKKVFQSSFCISALVTCLISYVRLRSMFLVSGKIMEVISYLIYEIHCNKKMSWTRNFTLWSSCLSTTKNSLSEQWDGWEGKGKGWDREGKEYTEFIKWMVQIMQSLG